LNLFKAATTHAPSLFNEPGLSQLQVGRALFVFCAQDRVSTE
jgi:hypothetical protein